MDGLQFDHTKFEFSFPVYVLVSGHDGSEFLDFKKISLSNPIIEGVEHLGIFTDSHLAESARDGDETLVAVPLGSRSTLVLLQQIRNDVQKIVIDPVRDKITYQTYWLSAVIDAMQDQLRLSDEE